MKRILILLAFTFAMSFAAFAQQEQNTPQDPNASQDTNLTQSQADQTDAKAPLMTLKGTVKADGDQFTFVNDKDGKSWNVMNPEELKGHDGHHVELTAHVYSDKNSIHIMSVKMTNSDSMGK